MIFSTVKVKEARKKYFQLVLLMTQKERKTRSRSESGMGTKISQILQSNVVVGRRREKGESEGMLVVTKGQKCGNVFINKEGDKKKPRIPIIRIPMHSVHKHKRKEKKDATLTVASPFLISQQTTFCFSSFCANVCGRKRERERSKEREKEDLSSLMLASCDKGQRYDVG